MSSRAASVLACVTCLVAGMPRSYAVEAIEIGPRNTQDLPGGREADGIIGDFVLRNDKVEVLVSGNQHERKANMATYWDAPSAGCIFDFTFRGANNDQLTLFAPGGQKGQLSQVFILRDGRDGEAIVRAERTAAAGEGLAKRHDYILRDGWRHVVVVSTYTNKSETVQKVRPNPRWAGLVSEVVVDDVYTGLCQDPEDRIGYANAGLEWDRARPATSKEITLQPGQSASFAAALAIGAGAADAYGVIKSIGAESHEFTGQVIDAAGKPVSGAVFHFASPQGKGPLTGYTDRDGKYRFTMPESTYRATVAEIGRETKEVSLRAGEPQTVEVGPIAGVRVQVTSAAGEPLPCKVQFTGIEGTADPDLGPIIRAHGCDNQYHSENGDFFQGLPPGRYHVTITRGIEYDHVEQDIAVEAGKTAEVKTRLNRVVDTSGWVSCDFHNHTTESGDNYCGTPDRVINLAAEHIEFAPTTEHNRISDWQPHIDRLGLTQQIRTVKGLELTGNGPHLNAFPLPVTPNTQDNGAPQWDPDARINALRLRNMEGSRDKRWVQLNHPNMERYFNDLNGDKQADGGFAGLLALIDGAEVYGQYILTGQRHYQVEWRGKMYERDNWPLLWMQMLNAGQKLVTVATSDAHEVTQGGVGGWRSYIQSSTDEPAAINPDEIIANAKKGRILVTTGPFVGVRTEQGNLPGDTIKGTKRVELKVRVQCNTWTDVDRVVVLVNGRPDPKCDFKRAEHPEMFSKNAVRFERTIPVELTGDAHLIVVAISESSTLKTGYGKSWQSNMHPVGYPNPIFVDVDGDGFKPNYDTLGRPYLDYGFPPGTTMPE